MFAAQAHQEVDQDIVDLGRNMNVIDGKEVYPTNQASRKGLDRPDVEKLKQFGVGQIFKELPYEDYDTDSEESPEKAGAFSVSFQRKDRSPLKMKKDSQLDENKYYDEIFNNPRTFREKSQRYKVKQLIKFHDYDQQEFGRRDHERQYNPEALKKKSHYVPFSEGRYQNMVRMIKNGDSAMGGNQINLSHKSSVRMVTLNTKIRLNSDDR